MGKHFIEMFNLIVNDTNSTKEYSNIKLGKNVLSLISSIFLTI